MQVLNDALEARRVQLAGDDFTAESPDPEIDFHPRHVSHDSIQFESD